LNTLLLLALITQSSTCAVDLDGVDDRIDVADAAALNPVSKFSVRLWVAADAWTTQATVFVSKYSPDLGSGTFYLDASTVLGSVRAVLCTSPTCSTITNCSGWTGLFPPDGTMHQVGMTYDGTNPVGAQRCHVYFDGADTTVSTVNLHPAVLYASVADLSVGTWHAGARPRDLNGRVDEFAYAVGETWSADEMWADYNNGVPGLPPPTPATVWWRMGEDDSCTGSTVTDASGNGFTGTLRNQAAFVSSTYAAPSEPACASGDKLYQIYPIIGQSNGSGRGLGEGPTPLHGDRIYLYGNDEVWSVDPREPIDSGTNQVDTISLDTNARVGPALAFADALADSWPDKRIVLVPCTKGGTSTLEWTPGQGTTGRLFGSCTQRVAEAIVRAGGSAVAELGGIVLYQGEQDAYSSTTYNATQWPRRWRNTIRRMRSVLGQPCTPLVYVRIAPTQPNTSYTAWSAVRAVQETFDTFPGVFDAIRVDAPDGPYVPAEAVHLDTPAQLVLGPAIRDAYLLMRYAGLITP
jgi:carbohydrate esterase-like sialic acid-specific acetylesterase